MKNALNLDYLKEVLKSFQEQKVITTEETERYLDYMKKELNNVYENENLISYYYNVFEKFNDWIPNIKKTSIVAFNISRCIDLIAFAYVANYIDETSATEQINKLGKKAEKLFSNWQDFLISAIVGKYIKSLGSSLTIADFEQYQLDCCKLATNKYKPLEVSGLWVNSDVSLLESKLKELTVGGVDSYINNIVSITNQVLMPLLEAYDLKYIFSKIQTM